MNVNKTKAFYPAEKTIRMPSSNYSCSLRMWKGTYKEFDFIFYNSVRTGYTKDTLEFRVI